MRALMQTIGDALTARQEDAVRTALEALIDVVDGPLRTAHRESGPLTARAHGQSDWTGMPHTTTTGGWSERQFMMLVVVLVLPDSSSSPRGGWLWGSAWGAVQPTFLRHNLDTVVSGMVSIADNVQLEPRLPKPPCDFVGRITRLDSLPNASRTWLYSVML